MFTARIKWTTAALCAAGAAALSVPATSALADDAVSYPIHKARLSITGGTCVAGGTVKVSGGGFAPGAKVKLSAHSNASGAKTAAGELKASAVGQITGSVKLASGKARTHTVEAHGPAVGGGTAIAKVECTERDGGSNTNSQTHTDGRPQPYVDGGSHNTHHGQTVYKPTHDFKGSTVAHKGALPFTGAPLLAGSVIMALVLAAGTVLLLVFRRRRT